MFFTTFDLYGLATIGLVGLIFVFVRQIPVYVVLVALFIAAFVTITFWLVPTESLANRVVMTLGLLASAFGLLIVRVMLIRSVSLQLLGRLNGRTSSDLFDGDIRTRLHDMQLFHLIRTDRGMNALTPFGQLIGGGIAACYTILRIQR